MKKTDTALSIKMNKEEIAAVDKAAKEHGETRSKYARRVLVESANYPFYTGEDVMQFVMEIAVDMARLNGENFNEVSAEINKKGSVICQILSSK